jgi:hypothetical protein
MMSTTGTTYQHSLNCDDKLGSRVLDVVGDIGELGLLEAGQLLDLRHRNTSVLRNLLLVGL